MQVNLSTRPDKSVGSDDIWDTAESALQTALEIKVPLSVIGRRADVAYPLLYKGDRIHREPGIHIYRVGHLRWMRAAAHSTGQRSTLRYASS